MTMSRGLPLLGLAALAAIGLAWLAPDQGYTLNIVLQACTYAIAVTGIVVVLGYCGQISIAQAAFFGIGAYGVAIGTVDYGMNFMAALALGVLVAGILGLILGLGSLRLGGHYLAMVTISFQQILTQVLTNWIGFTHGPDGIRNIPRPVILGISFENGRAYLALCVTTSSPPAPAASTPSQPRSPRSASPPSSAPSAAACSPAASATSARTSSAFPNPSCCSPWPCSAACNPRSAR
jgi:ABC-type branched-subunit amino acid transport system permease subunit